MPANAKVTILGNLTRDPQTRSVGDRTVTSFTVAVNTLSKKDDGSFESNFYDVSVWGKSGEYLMQKLQKSSMVLVTGDLAMVEYTAKDNSPRQALRVTATDVRGVARLKGDDAGSGSAKQSDDNELPF